MLTFLSEKKSLYFCSWRSSDQNIYSFRGSCFKNSQLFFKAF
ncbi:hypothetical protein J8J04_01640 ['Fragaria x ananassa' phyllody phytoplasma]|uniref:Uncharacterized protein n=1 Tax='Fragaria x ananassa' phyllody phytoplasma TaxID=2358428 RepID=A0ABS5K3B0_9MOLU|nr:hypothetical protein ['Fragaria x ananassa' phyllody phytoplasma]